MIKLVFLAALVAVAVADVSHLVHHAHTKVYKPVAVPVGVAVPVVVAKHVVQQPAHHGEEIAILRSESDISPEGSYQFAYETANGISAQEQGSVKAVAQDQAVKQAQGSFSYTSPEGEQVQVQYVADENGFQPTGTHLPVAPEIPAAILRSLEWIAAHPHHEEHARQYQPQQHQPQQHQHQQHQPQQHQPQQHQPQHQQFQKRF